MTRKCIISAVVMFVMAWALSFVTHELLLRADYAATAGMRPTAEVMARVHLLVLAHAFFGAAFAWIYFQGKEDKPWLAQGIRFGLAVACLTTIPTFLIYHVVTPVEFSLAIKQIVFDTIRVVLMGIVLGWINR
jgi:hypothetical protein